MNDKALPAWDLSDLYDGIEDEKIAADLEKYRAFCVEFAGRYKGRLSELDGAGIAAALKAKKAELKDAQKQLAKIEKQEAALAEQAAQNQRKADAEKLATAFLESGKSLDEVLRALQ